MTDCKLRPLHDATQRGRCLVHVSWVTDDMTRSAGASCPCPCPPVPGCTHTRVRVHGTLTVKAVFFSFMEEGPARDLFHFREIKQQFPGSCQFCEMSLTSTCRGRGCEGHLDDVPVEVLCVTGHCCCSLEQHIGGKCCCQCPQQQVPHHPTHTARASLLGPMDM